MLAAVDASKRKLGNFVVDGESNNTDGSIGVVAFFPFIYLYQIIHIEVQDFSQFIIIDKISIGAFN
jgi:hypothetical protein